MKHSPFIRKISLFYKIASLVSITLTIAIGVYTAVSIRQQGKIIKTELIEKNKAVSKHLASSIKSAFWTLNWLFVERQMEEITKSEDTLFLKLIKPNGEVYFYSGFKDCDNNILLPDLKDMKNQAIKDIVCSINGEPLKLIVTPIMVGNEKWDLIMGLSLKAVEAARKCIIKENIALGGAIFLLGVLASFFFARAITRPIEQLMKGEKEIGKGNLDYRIKITGHDELGSLADSFNNMAEDLKNTTISRDELANEVNERRQAEEALKESEQKFRSIVENSHGGIFILNNDYRFIYVNEKLCEIVGYPMEEIIDRNFQYFLDEENKNLVADRYGQKQEREDLPPLYEFNVVRKNGEKRRVEVSVSVINNPKGIPQTIAQILDITDRKILESQLSQAQKLESIGQLAAGIAHEINTPIQYVGDNTRFLQDAFTDFKGVLESYGQLLKAVKEGSSAEHAVLETERRIEDVDIEYLSEEIPTAVQQTLEGVERVSKIVRSMKEFSHPGVSEKTAIDINKALESTITISRNEWKYVAEMETDLDPSLPLVTCLPGELNQVFLNMIINAAHAITEVVGDGSTEKGTIKIGTRSKDDLVEISISDTGCGIPEKIRSRIFDPFFTTKKVGKGTGQGLAISHSVIVEKHGGTVDFHANEGRGTTFYIHLPVKN